MTAPQAKTGVEVERLPELPPTDKNYWQPVANGTGWVPGFSSNTGPADGWEVTKYYTADQMRAYATAALAAEREEVERLMGDLRASDEDRLELHKANRLLADEAVRMREALGSINDLYDDQCNSSQLASRMYDASCIARAALSPSQQGN